MSRSKFIINFCGVFLPDNYETKILEDINLSVFSSDIIILDISLFSPVDLEAFCFKHQDFLFKIILIVPYESGWKYNHISVIGKFGLLIPYPVNNPRILEYYRTSVEKLLYQKEKNEILGEIELYNSDFMNSVIVGDSYKIRELRSKLAIAARTEGVVLLLGESGTGKTCGARIIHQNSRRNKGAFVSRSVADFPEELSEGMLFGIEEGAYTDAQARNGILKTARGGTIFIDEIGMASLSLQGKFMAVMDGGSFYSLGSDREFYSDARFIFATNENLKRKIHEQKFKPELYFRMEQQIIHFPSLRDCKEDIKKIASYYVGEKQKTLREDALEKLENYDWPGNVRQLKNYIERACNYTDRKEITAKDIIIEY